jgi:cytochrome c oxidase subunit 1
MYDERWGRCCAVIVFVGLNLAFFPQFILGSRGMPRRYYNYLPEFQGLHRLSTLGAFVLGLGFLLTAFYLWRALRNGKRAADNPWGALTLEWKTASPVPYYNFKVAPRVTAGPYDGYENLTYDPQLGGYVEKPTRA